MHHTSPEYITLNQFLILIQIEFSYTNHIKKSTLPGCCRLSWKDHGIWPEGYRFIKRDKTRKKIKTRFCVNAYTVDKEEHTIEWLHCYLQRPDRCWIRRSSTWEALMDRSLVLGVSVLSISKSERSYKKQRNEKKQSIKFTLALLLMSMPDPPILFIQHSYEKITNPQDDNKERDKLYDVHVNLIESGQLKTESCSNQNCQKHKRSKFFDRSNSNKQR